MTDPARASAGTGEAPDEGYCPPHHAVVERLPTEPDEKSPVNADAMKFAVCEYLLHLNRHYDPPLIPPTAIDWLGDGIVAAAIAAVEPAEPAWYTAKEGTVVLDQHGTAWQRWPGGWYAGTVQGSHDSGPLASRGPVTVIYEPSEGEK